MKPLSSHSTLPLLVSKEHENHIDLFCLLIINNTKRSSKGDAPFMSSIPKQFLLVISEASCFHFILKLTWERLCDTLLLSSPVFNCYLSSCFGFLLVFSLFLGFWTSFNHWKDHMFLDQPFCALVLPCLHHHQILKWLSSLSIYTITTNSYFPPRIGIEENETSICLQLWHGICTSCYSSIFLYFGFSLSGVLTITSVIWFLKICT